MKQITLKLEEDLLNTVKKRAEERGIKPARFLRSLIEKGLVLDHQLKQGTDHLPSGPTRFEQSLAEMIAENLCLSRKAIRSQLPAEEAEEALVDARKRAQSLIKKLCQPTSD